MRWGLAAVVAIGALGLWRRRWIIRLDPAWLEAVQKEILFRVPRTVPGRKSKGGDRAASSVLFLVYRKTGVEASVRLCYALSDTVCKGFQGAFSGPWFQNSSNVRFGRSEDWSGRPLGVVLSPAWEQLISPGIIAMHKYAFVIVPSSSWLLPRNVRVVHWVREPLSLILSGYRYAKSHSLEPWQSWRSHCWSCDESANRAMFRTCDHRCSYNDLLQNVDEEQGVLLEAIMDRAMLQHMLSNMQRWANHPNVLHVSVSHLRADYVGTARCMLRFLGLADDHLVERMKRLHDDPRSLCQANATFSQGLCDWIYKNEHTRNDRHTTSGRYNNTGLQNVLLQNPVWAEHFHAAKEAMAVVFRKQEALYGCPSAME